MIAWLVGYLSGLLVGGMADWLAIWLTSDAPSQPYAAAGNDETMTMGTMKKIEKTEQGVW